MVIEMLKEGITNLTREDHGMILMDLEVQGGIITIGRLGMIAVTGPLVTTRTDLLEGKPDGSFRIGTIGTTGTISLAKVWKTEKPGRNDELETVLIGQRELEDLEEGILTIEESGNLKGSQAPIRRKFFSILCYLSINNGIKVLFFCFIAA